MIDVHKITRLVLSLTILAIIGCNGSSEPSFRTTEIGENIPTSDFTLTNQHGEPFTLSEHEGKVVLLFFGFTYCPDVCPATLSTWKRVQDALEESSEKVEFVYITVDPERDTPEKMQQHLSVFSSDFIGLTGDKQALQKVYSDYGVYREKVEVSESASGYLINHTSRIYVIDKQGRWRLSIPHDTPVKDIVHDVKELINETPPMSRIRIEDVWSRPAHAASPGSDKMGSTGVVYFSVINESDTPDRLLSARSDIAEVVELHQTTMEEGRMRMEMLKDGVTIPANDRLDFAPRGYHVMLIGLNRDLKLGESFEMTLKFEKAGEKSVESVVRHPS